MSNLLNQDQITQMNPNYLPESTPLDTMIDAYLGRQSDMSAVERFAQFHENSATPLQERYYRELMPLELPGEGQQYAFEVDLDLCSGCKACVTACHNQNGLEENETWRDVGYLYGTDTNGEYRAQHVTTSCHHCLEPGCMKGCPVNAYEKDGITGIVHHLDDQCIGCQYCTFTCPYDVPKYSPTLGIVRKCNMCSDRLAGGEAPACVQACPTEAIRINIVDNQDVAARNLGVNLISGSASSEFTHPTTTFKKKDPLAGVLRSGSNHLRKASPAHTPLIIMLLLTQLSVGMHAMNWFFRSLLADISLSSLTITHAVISLFSAIIAMGASTFHLGRPLYAFRAIVGLRTSWLSREIILFIAYAFSSIIFAFMVLYHPINSGWTNLSDGVNYAVLIFGLSGVFSSVMVYHRTPRYYWNFIMTGPKFFLTTIILGATGVLSISIFYMALLEDTNIQTHLKTICDTFCAIIMVATLVKLAAEQSIVLPTRKLELKPIMKILKGDLREITIFRVFFCTLSGLILPVYLYYQVNFKMDNTFELICVSVLIFIFSLIGEILERRLFFMAASTTTMPGKISN